MPLELQREATDGVPNPDGAHASFFIDENGQPVLKNSLGVVQPAFSLVGDSTGLNKQSSAPAALNNTGHVYSKNVSDITELFYRDDLGNTGKETQVTLDGNLNVGGRSSFFGGANIGSFVVSVPSGATGDVPINSGIIFPILGTNQLTTLHMRIHGIGDSVHDVGYQTILFAWAALPILPAAGFSATYNVETYGHSSGSGSSPPSVFSSIFDEDDAAAGITLNAAGEIILHFDDTVKSSTYEAQVHLSVGGFITVRDPTLP